MAGGEAECRIFYKIITLETDGDQLLDPELFCKQTRPRFNPRMENLRMRPTDYCCEIQPMGPTATILSEAEKPPTEIIATIKAH